MAAVMAMAWLKESDWPRWSEIDAMCTFPQWEAKMQRMADQVKASGITPVRVPVDPEMFVAWCKKVGRHPSSANRAAYAAVLHTMSGMTSDPLKGDPRRA